MSCVCTSSGCRSSKQPTTRERGRKKVTKAEPFIYFTKRNISRNSRAYRRSLYVEVEIADAFQQHPYLVDIVNTQ